jgi:hypothetical protein
MARDDDARIEPCELDLGDWAQISVGPDDVLVLVAPENLAEDAALELNRAIPDQLRGRVLVVSSDWTIAVARDLLAEAAEDTALCGHATDGIGSVRLVCTRPPHGRDVNHWDANTGASWADR